jgi:hypothetical protein
VEANATTGVDATICTVVRARFGRHCSTRIGVRALTGCLEFVQIRIGGWLPLFHVELRKAIARERGIDLAVQVAVFVVIYMESNAIALAAATIGAVVIIRCFGRQFRTFVIAFLDEGKLAEAVGFWSFVPLLDVRLRVAIFGERRFEGTHVNIAMDIGIQMIPNASLPGEALVRAIFGVGFLTGKYTIFPITSGTCGELVGIVGLLGGLLA